MVEFDTYHLYGLAVFEGSLYYTDWKSRNIQRANQTTGGNATILISGLEQPRDIHAFHRGRNHNGEGEREGGGGGEGEGGRGGERERGYVGGRGREGVRKRRGEGSG